VVRSLLKSLYDSFVTANTQHKEASQKGVANKLFIGHFAVGFGAKQFAPRANLAILMAAPIFADILWPIFLLLGWEHARVDPGNTKFTPLALCDYPWSHSLLMLFVWACIFAGIYFALTRYRAGAIAIWLGVLSHWVLDWITHRPDMPLYPHGGPMLGLSLWNSIPGTLIVELAMFAAGIALYVRTTRARDHIGTWAFIGFVALLLFAYISGRFGGPPDSIHEIAVTGLIATAISLPWIWWFDKHRALRRPE
jgi:hypothetical protein